MGLGDRGVLELVRGRTVSPQEAWSDWCTGSGCLHTVCSIAELLVRSQSVTVGAKFSSFFWLSKTFASCLAQNTNVQEMSNFLRVPTYCVVQ